MARRRHTLTAEDVASVVIARSASKYVPALTLQKLLYYVQAWSLAITGKPLFREQIKAWANGPVIPQVWHSRKSMVSRVRLRQRHVELDDEASNLIDLVLATYGSMSGSQLRALTHKETPWREARKGLPENAPSDAVISHESMARFYRLHGRLAGHTAADLASGGLYSPRGSARSRSIDVDALISSIDDALFDPGDDPWGGANLDAGCGFGQSRRSSGSGGAD